MTDGERELILRRLFDKELLPYTGEEPDVSALETLTDREREVFAAEIEQELAILLAGGEALLRMAPRGVSRFAKLTAWLSMRWRSARMTWAKKGSAK